MVKLSELCHSMLAVSEKAANVARTIRSEDTLFELLIEEKSGDQKNPISDKDFKTLGDVLIQETVKHDLNKKFEGFGHRIFGEESNTFMNQLGEKITVEVKDSVDKTSDLLKRVLNGKVEAADLLAKAVHTDIVLSEEPCLADVTEDIDVSNVGVWIDPIDSTAQYIKGIEDCESVNGIYREGLQCVTVLIGAYNMDTGLPFFGIINQPFSMKDHDAKRWIGRCHWGLNYNRRKINNLSVAKQRGLGFMLNWQEKQSIQDKFKNHAIDSSHGAGYKMLCIALGLTRGYPVSLGGSYRWDTCAPQAILTSLGGGILDYSKTVNNAKSMDLAQVFNGKSELPDKLAKCQVLYHQPNEGVTSDTQCWYNNGGLIGFSSNQNLHDMLEILVDQINQ